MATDKIQRIRTIDQAKIAEHIGHLYAAFGDHAFCDIDELLSDSAHLLNGFRSFGEAIPPLIGQVREVALIVRETSSPTSIIAMDVFDRLRKIERTLMEWTGEIEPSESDEILPAT